jgi:hypothetical protein
LQKLRKIPVSKSANDVLTLERAGLTRARRLKAEMEVATRRDELIEKSPGHPAGEFPFCRHAAKAFGDSRTRQPEMCRQTDG